MLYVPKPLKLYQLLNNSLVLLKTKRCHPA